jgi:hypothetical protein
MSAAQDEALKTATQMSCPRRATRVLAAALPIVFPLLIAAVGAGLWQALARTGDLSPAQR